MTHPALDRFGQFIIQRLYDPSIEYCDGLLAGHWNSPESQPLQAELATLTDAQRELVRKCVVASLTSGLHSMLFGLSQLWEDDDEFSVMVDGMDVASLSDGLEGEPYSDAGWIAKFSSTSNSSGDVNGG